MDVTNVSFQSPKFLRRHIQSILEFYKPNIVDSAGGFFQNFLDDGTVFSPGQRHLVSSCRMVFNYCKAFELFGDRGDYARAEHGLAFIREHHWDATRGGYNWTLQEGTVADDKTNHCYGLAFVILSAAAAHELGIDGAREDVARAYALLEEHLWDASVGLYADEATPDWGAVSAYRGQNANMHCCEALIAAFEATGEKHYLDRSYAIAKTVAVKLAARSDGLIWEHFTADLKIDWDYNKDDPKNLYRPWGFQPGHQTEWAKLLLTLYTHRPEAWMVNRAKELFDRAMAICWDKEHRGVFYGFAPDNTICDDDKYFWVQAESIAASARLYAVTGETQYAIWYESIWQYAWQQMIDHRYGAWCRVLRADNSKYSEEKSTAGGKCDYHTLGACWDVLRVWKI